MANDIVKKLISLKKEESGHITFVFRDETKQRQSINRQFFYDDRGKDLPIQKVIYKINDICHDLKALYYEIE